MKPMNQQIASPWEVDPVVPGDGLLFYSYTTINTFSSICPLQAWFRIQRFPKERVAANLVFGGAFEKAGLSVDEDLIKGRKPNLGLALEVLRSHLERAYSDRDVPVVSTHGDTLENLFAMGKRMFEHYVSTLSPDEETLDLPRTFTVPLFNRKGDALARPLFGEIDRWVKTKDGQIGIVDRKTSEKRWHVSKIEKDDQPTCYLMGSVQILGRRADFFYFDVSLKTKEPGREPYYADRDERAERRFIKKCEGLEATIQSGKFVPNDSSFSCPTCSYRNACRKWQDKD